MLKVALRMCSVTWKVGVALLLCAELHGQSVSVQMAIGQDPAPDKANPASLQAFSLPSHGSQLNALAYVAAGAGLHPTVILLHGFPGNERNLDLAQSIRRAGWNVLFFDYRGSWGSPGEFSFTHSIEDTQAAIAFLRDAGNAAKLHSDGATIVLAGHDVGALMAFYAAAHDPAIKAVVAISGTDINAGGMVSLPQAQQGQVVHQLANALADEDMAPLAGCTPEGLAKEVLANAASWNALALAPKFADRPVLLVSSDDGLAPLAESVAAVLRKSGDPHVTALHLATDHSYSGERIALEQAVLGFLATVKQ